MDEKAKVVAIDGPSGSGKSTIAKRVAEKLNFLYIDTGAMFRALGYYFDQKNIAFDDLETIDNELLTLDFDYSRNPSKIVSINGENLADKIREHHVSKLASDISKLTSIRNYLFIIQREIGMAEFSVMEGRDIGTVVFPDAGGPMMNARSGYKNLAPAKYCDLGNAKHDMSCIPSTAESLCIL